MTVNKFRNRALNFLKMKYGFTGSIHEGNFFVDIKTKINGKEYMYRLTKDSIERPDCDEMTVIDAFINQVIRLQNQEYDFNEGLL